MPGENVVKLRKNTSGNHQIAGFVLHDLHKHDVCDFVRHSLVGWGEGLARPTPGGAKVHNDKLRARFLEDAVQITVARRVDDGHGDWNNFLGPLEDTLRIASNCA